jgi:NAD(P)H-hydrate epimerase
MAGLDAGARAAALLTVAEMGRADALAIEAGTPGIELMERAGTGVADAIVARWSPRPVVVLAGPGNNGGDGFVAGRALADRGWPVRIALAGDRQALKGDAALAAARWDGPVVAFGRDVLSGGALVIDAVFGAGLARPLDGVVREVIETADAGRDVAPIIAVDVPSGLHGDTGQVMGAAPRATLTVTFFRRKPGHLLMPGRALCGAVEVVDIGIPDAVLDRIGPRHFADEPALWGSRFPRPRADGHKYDRGHAVAVSGGVSSTGACRLAATAALRVGAGLVTVASPPSALLVNAAHLTAVMVRPVDGPAGLADLLSDRRKNAVLVGPGAGIGEETRALATVGLDGPRSVVLDADALTSFADAPDDLWRAIAAPGRGGAPVVLTPHEGEFGRIFPDLGRDLGRVERARRAAARAGAVVLLKGPDTVVAAPDGRAAINAEAPPWLATAGSGDVLAGLILGLVAQGMTGFDAAAAAAWIHGAAAKDFGPGLIAEDLATSIPPVLRRLSGEVRGG